MSMKWLTGKDFAKLFRFARRAEVKVEVNGQSVPVLSARYDALEDAYIIRLDEDCEDYRFAMHTDPIPEEGAEPAEVPARRSEVELRREALDQ